MNYSFKPAGKLHNIKDERVDQSLDKIYDELRRLNTILQAYDIDLTTDITGVLPAANLGTVLPASLGGATPGSATKFYNEAGNFVTISTNGSDASGIRTFFQTHVADSWRDMGCATSAIAGSSALQVDAGGDFQRFTTAAGANGTGGWRMSGGQFWADHNPDLVYRVRTGSSVANIRMWVGAFASLPGGSVDTPTGRAFGFRFSTVAGDAGWRGFWCDSSSVITLTSSIVVPVASTIYDMRAVVSGGGTLITFTINGVSATLSPTSFTGALLTTLLQVGADGAGAARFIDFSRCHVETN